ncbi:MAG: hypothetical protein JSR54_17820, partial [Proteobacteria bacterium]|nr:hypothetical protein [Pseudomonadota bacterium]
MERRHLLGFAAALWLGVAWPGAAAPPSIQAFAARLPVEGAVLSPDGRYLAVIRTDGDRGGVFVHDRRAPPGTPAKPVLAEPEDFRLNWCRFASDVRLVCSLRSFGHVGGMAVSYPRLVAVDADGGQRLLLLQDVPEVARPTGDSILHWHPGPPDTVLIEADEGLDDKSARALARGGSVIGNTGSFAQPAVWELNVRTGHLRQRQRGLSPVRHWIADPAGEVRLGYGQAGAELSYFGRTVGEVGWRRLEHFEAFSRGTHFRPVAISRDQPNKAYAIGDANGRAGLWLIDLAEQAPPELVFAHAAVDVAAPLVGADGRLTGIA